MFRAFFQKVRGWFSRFTAPKERLRRIVYFEGDELPAELPAFDLAVAQEGDLLWTAGMQCPCGCHRRLEVMLLPGVKPRWDLHVDRDGRPTLHPSIWVNDGCRAHFFLRQGKVEWV